MIWYDYTGRRYKTVYTLVFKNADGDVVKARKLNEKCATKPYRYELEGTEECGYIVFRHEFFYNQILMKIKVPGKKWVYAEVVKKVEKD